MRTVVEFERRYAAGKRIENTLQTSGVLLGDLYSCDHYVYPETRLGNILESPLPALVHSAAQQRFGRAPPFTPA